MNVSFGTFDALIVGRRYYDSHTKTGEHIELYREPCNPYDDNAIAAYSLGGQKLGHLPRWLAKVLAPCTDKIGCILKGKVTGPGNVYVTPIDLYIYAPLDASSRLRKQLDAYWDMWQLSVPASVKDKCNKAIPAENTGNRLLVISTAAGMGDWIAYLAGSRVSRVPCTIRWIVYSRSLPAVYIPDYQVVFVCASDAAYLLARASLDCWSHVAVDKTAIGESQLAMLPDLAPVLSTKTTFFV
ncbi:hypothetical protein IW148_003545 [Coemansia sp. RSA 1199]|nr:hypothetical protein IW148_003545 [Coemansia sp. RSA 1199]